MKADIPTYRQVPVPTLTEMARRGAKPEQAQKPDVHVEWCPGVRGYGCGWQHEVYWKLKIWAAAPCSDGPPILGPSWTRLQLTFCTLVGTQTNVALDLKTPPAFGAYNTLVCRAAEVCTLARVTEKYEACRCNESSRTSSNHRRHDIMFEYEMLLCNLCYTQACARQSARQGQRSGFLMLAF